MKSACLPSDPTAPKIRRSKSTRRRAGVLIGAHVLLALHIWHYQATGSSISPLEPSESMEFSKYSIINAGLIFFALTTVSTLIFGRFFCGWGCHLVALQDWARALLLKVGIRPRPLRSRALLLVPIAAFVYMFLWPVAYRVWVGDSFAVRAAHLTTNDFWKTFPDWGVTLFTFVVCGFVIIYFLGAKGFCTYACPYGALYGFTERFSPGRIRVTDACEGCAHCTATCTSNVLVHQEVHDYGMVVDPGCMKCLDCVSVCPKDALYFGFGKPAVFSKPRHEPRPRARAFSGWEELLLAVLFIGALFSFRGLYHLVPFLLALGIAGIVAFSFVQGLRLVTRADVQLPNLSFKRGGRVTASGWIFAGALVLFGAFWVHSGLVQFHGWRASVNHASLADLRLRFFDPGAPEATAEESALLERVEHHASFVQGHGLLPSRERAAELAWCALVDGRGDDFATQMSNALEAAPWDAANQLAMGRFRRGAGDLAAAMQHFEAAVEHDPGHFIGYAELGRTAAMAQDSSRAEQAFLNGLAALPENAHLHYDYGVLCAMTGRPEEAIERWERALAIEPDFLEALENLAGILSQVGRLEDGIALYRRAIELSPDDPDTRLRLAGSLAIQGSLDAAIQELQAAIERAPERQDLRTFMTQLLEAQEVRDSEATDR